MGFKGEYRHWEHLFADRGVIACRLLQGNCQLARNAKKRHNIENELTVTAKLNFVRQQGFRDASPEACSFQYPALIWQPRVIGILVLVGLAFQSGPYFLALAALLWWNVILPAFNPFDALYNRLVAKPKGLPRLNPAPAPRRFAQWMARTFMLAIGQTHNIEVSLLAYTL